MILYNNNWKLIYNNNINNAKYQRKEGKNNSKIII